MRTLHLLPIEPFEERYTEQWLRYFQKDLSRFFNVELILGKIENYDREGGEWLDPTKTWVWKGTQTANLAKKWAAGKIKEGDIIFSLDMWSSLTTAMLYMKATTGLDVILAAFYHAGATDPYDYLNRIGCGKWAIDIETGWAKGLDYIFCGSNWAKSLLINNCKVEGSNIYPTGNPIKQQDLLRHAQVVPYKERKNIVCFPHRLAPEKQPWLFDELQKKYNELYDDKPIFIKSKEVCENKNQYYDLLARSKVVFSAALQETFGIAQQEGAALGAWMLNPECLSYKEVTRQAGILYKPYNIEDAAKKLNYLLSLEESPFWDGWHEAAIYRMADILEKR